MGEELPGRGHRLRSSWLAAAIPAVRLWFEVCRVAGWRHAGRRRRLMVVLSALAVMSLGTGVTLAVTGKGQPGPVAPGPGNAAPNVTPPRAAAANRAQAAAWIARQVGSDEVVTCDPAMCPELQAAGFPAAKLKVLRATAGGLLASGVVVATPAIRDQFGARLAGVYAPLVIASFGSGAERVDIRAVAPDGAPAFKSRLALEQRHRIAAGKQLLGNEHIQASSAARAALAAGWVDSRLLVTLSVLASEMPLRLVAFDDPSPGASSAVPLRGAEIGAAAPAALSAVLAFLHAQLAPYQPAVAAIARSASGQSLVTVRFDAPGLMDVGAP